MSRKNTQSLADIGAIIRLTHTATPSSDQTDPVQHRRQLIADLCRLVEARIRGQIPVSRVPFPKMPHLSPRMRQTLQRLLAGDSEKQIACRLGLSRHTVHIYVKAIYWGFGVSSRGELLAGFVHPPGLD